MLQGVPVAVTDIGVVSRVGVLLRGRDVAGQPRSGDRNTRLSQLPAGNDPVVVNAPRTWNAWEDRRRVEHSPNDRDLPV